MNIPTYTVEATWVDPPPAKAEWIDISDHVEHMELRRSNGTATVILNGERAFHPRLRITGHWNGEDYPIFEGDT